MVGVWNHYFGPIGVNLSTVFLGLVVLVLAIIKKTQSKRTSLFEISFLLFLVGFSYFTLHGRLLQLIFPISLPERPLVDNNLTFNYSLTSLLTFLIFPILLLILLKSDVSMKRFGLKIQNLRQTLSWTFYGLVFTVILSLLSQTFFGFRWIQNYTFDGLILWTLLVTILSVSVQTYFFIGILFNAHIEQENKFLLAIISFLAFQSFTAASPLWTVLNIISFTAKIVVTWKTRNIYAATLMNIVSNFIDIAMQVI
jgi:hypothetical protein